MCCYLFWTRTTTSHCSGGLRTGNGRPASPSSQRRTVRSSRSSIVAEASQWTDFSACSMSAVCNQRISTERTMQEVEMNPLDIPAIPRFRIIEVDFSPGCWSLGLTWAFRRSKLLRFHSILSIRFRYFAKLCNYLIQHHTPLIVFSMEMAPCCLGLMVCGYLYHNVIVVYYTFDVYRSPLSSSC